MPEHVPLLDEPPRILLAQFLKAVKQTASRKLRGSLDQFWQERYYDSNVYGEKARSEVIRYIHRNPGQARTGREARRLAVVQLSTLRDRSERSGRDRIAVDRIPTREPVAGGSAAKEGRPIVSSQCFRREGGPGMNSWMSDPPAHRKKRDERGTALGVDFGS
jgi:hypothetical protein